MIFKFRITIPTSFDLNRLENYCKALGLSGQVIIYRIEEDEDENTLGYVDVVLPNACTIIIRETTDANRLEGRVAHEITHVSLERAGYRNLVCHTDSLLTEENMYYEYIQQFANFLHHQILYPKLINGGFSLDDDDEIVNKYYSDTGNISRMVQAYQSNERFAKAWVIISIMNDLIRLSDKEILYNLLKKSIPKALDKAEEILREIGSVNTIDEYERSKNIIEQKLNLPKFNFDGGKI